MTNADWQQLDDFIAQALAEDIGDGDHTTLATIPAGATGTAQCKVKDTGILAGMEVARRIFAQSPDAMQFNALAADGNAVYPGKIAFTVSGSVRTLLTYERLVLNIMQRMSGIATQTRQAAQRIAHTPCKLLDTRKTTPLNRMLEKWAVRIGGGHNHRIGLYDMVLVKDNHIDYAGGIEQALQGVQTYLQQNGKQLEVEVEARTADHVRRILAVQAKGMPIRRILLDNMTTEQLKQCVAIVNKQTETEASGGITLDNIRAVAETGVDYISMGALTHTFKSLDISLKIVSPPHA
jgi:nicotinate-nucleotide pyrophosphorylase (carboxylating)